VDFTLIFDMLRLLEKYILLSNEMSLLVSQDSVVDQRGNATFTLIAVK
jgi:hypothetical protein